MFENAKPLSAFLSHLLAWQFGSSTVCSVQCCRPSQAGSCKILEEGGSGLIFYTLA